MTRVARLVGVLVLGLALAELAMTAWAGVRGQGGPIPAWNGQAWAPPLRAAFEYASFAALAAVGAVMALRLDRAPPLLAGLLAAAAARIGYDWLVWRAGGERLSELLRADLNFAVLVALGLFACLVAQDEASALAAREFPEAAAHK